MKVYIVFHTDDPYESWPVLHVASDLDLAKALIVEHVTHAFSKAENSKDLKYVIYKKNDEKSGRIRLSSVKDIVNDIVCNDSIEFHTEYGIDDALLYSIEEHQIKVPYERVSEE